MKWSCVLLGIFACGVGACSETLVEGVTEVEVEPRVEERPVVEYVEWSEDQTGTSAKPAFNKGCRYRASAESMWELTADGPNDLFALSGEAAGQVSLSLSARVDGVEVMGAVADLQRVLSGKAYYEASGTMSFSEASTEAWTVIDGTLCFESSLVGSPTEIAAEFSLIARSPDGNALRSVGGTFVLAAEQMPEGTTFAINDDAIALDLR